MKVNVVHLYMIVQKQSSNIYIQGVSEKTPHFDYADFSAFLGPRNSILDIFQQSTFFLLFGDIWNEILPKY